MRITSILISFAILAFTSYTSSSYGFYNARIELGGKITNEAGELIEDVEVEVTKSKVSIFSASFTSRDTAKLQVKGGTFRIECRRCSSVQLYFTKRGFYSETRSYSVDKDAADNDSRFGTNTEDLELNDITVVLRSDANKVRLERLKGRLNSSADGVETVFPLTTGLGSFGVSLEHLQSNAPGSSYVQLVPVRGETGALLAKPTPETKGAVMQHPMPATVEFSGDGGFLVYKTSSVNPATIYREMRTAPASGYLQSLRLEMPFSENLYFYFRDGDLYGKGHVVQPSFDHHDGKRVVTSYITIRMNMDGSRNVETAN